MKTPNKTNSNPTGCRSVSLVLNSLLIIKYLIQHTPCLPKSAQKPTFPVYSAAAAACVTFGV